MPFLPQDGDGFFICEDQEEFLTSKILEKYKFKTNSYGSFIRQLNNCKYSPCSIGFLFFQDKLSHVLSCSEISTLPSFWPKLAPVFGEYFRSPVFA